MAGRPLSVRTIRIATLLLLWVAWEALARSGLLYEGVVPSSLVVLHSAVQQLATAEFYGHLWRTAYEVAIGFATGVLAALAFGIALGVRSFADDAAAPYLQGLASTPKIVFLPILMLLFGVGAGSKIAMSGLSAFFPVVIATASGMRGINPTLVRVAHSFHATPWQIVRKVYLPALVEPVVSGARLGLGVAIIGALLAEIKFSDRGLGHLAIQHYNLFHVADMYAVLLVTFALAVAANALMTRLSTRLVRRR